jgi:hypothetical protein
LRAKQQLPDGATYREISYSISTASEDILHLRNDMPNPAKAKREFERAILSLEKRRKSRIFSIIHTADPQHICGPDFLALRRNREQFNNVDTLEILIHSPGGHAHQAYRLARHFRTHCKRLNALVPRFAKSAATILCLNADSIFMGEFAELGPIDTQIKDEMEKGQEYFAPLDEFKSVEFLREYSSDILDYLSFVLAQRGMSVKQSLHEAMNGVIGLMSPLYGHIDPSKLGSYRQALAEGEDYAKRLLATKFDEDKAAEMARHLVWDYPAHDFVIDRNEAREIGLPVQKLALTDEKAILGAITELAEYDMYYLGFVKHETQNRSKPNRAKRKGPRKVPTPIKANRQAVTN